MDIARYNIFNRLHANESLFLFGPRGSGKTSYVKKWLKGRNLALYINLLQYQTLSVYLNNPGRFRREIEEALPKRGRLEVVVDEVQKLPPLLDEVHALIEENPKRVRFILTGSSARKIRRGQANLLAGRATTLYMHPLSLLEIDVNLARALQWGTLPAAYLRKRNPERFLRSYVETYLKEEILQESIVRRAEHFIRFLELAGQYHGEIVNYSKLAHAAGVATTTCQEYFAILKDTLAVWELPGWSESLRHQLTMAPRFYFFDCGVVNALRRELRLELHPHTSRFGKLFETFVILEMLRANDYMQAGCKAYHWRTSRNREIDLILHGPAYSAPAAIEIKSDIHVDEKSLSTLHSFKEDYPSARLYCLCRTDKPYHIGDIQVLPWQTGIVKILKETAQGQRKETI